MDEMSDPELVEIWQAIRALNRNQLTLQRALDAAVNRLSQRLMLQEATSAAIEMDQPRSTH